MKRMLADVLWEAANDWLWDGVADYGEFCGVEYSCAAVVRCIHPDPTDDALSFLEELGCDTSSAMLEFGEPMGPQRQGARYMWLLLAMHVAEDEGIEV
jgi:hypothetical protein